MDLLFLLMLTELVNELVGWFTDEEASSADCDEISVDMGFTEHFDENSRQLLGVKTSIKIFTYYDLHKVLD